MIAKPPLIQEIERVQALYAGELAKAMPDFRAAGALRKRNIELLTHARANGWSTLPGDDRPPPTAPAMTSRAA